MFVSKDKYNTSLSDFVHYPLHNYHIKPRSPFWFTISNLLYSSKATLGTFNREQSKLMIRNLSSEVALTFHKHILVNAQHHMRQRQTLGLVNSQGERVLERELSP